MFTGIAEECGRIIRIRNTGGGRKIIIAANKVLHGTKPGDSICTDGVCLTATDLGDDFFTADVSEETLRYTILGDRRTGDQVNLERALSVGTRLGGHIVSGHVDGRAVLKKKEADGDSYLFTFSCDEDIMAFIVKKGSVTVNGISLTVAETGADDFSVELIPHTLSVTNLGFLRPGDKVNIENDIIGKYISHFLKDKAEEKTQGMTYDMLKNLA